MFPTEISMILLRSLVIEENELPLSNGVYPLVVIPGTIIALLFPSQVTETHLNIAQRRISSMSIRSSNHSLRLSLYWHTGVMASQIAVCSTAYSAIKAPHCCALLRRKHRWFPSQRCGNWLHSIMQLVNFASDDEQNVTYEINVLCTQGAIYSWDRIRPAVYITD